MHILTALLTSSLYFWLNRSYRKIEPKKYYTIHILIIEILLDGLDVDYNVFHRPCESA